MEEKRGGVTVNEREICIVGAGLHARANIYPSILLVGGEVAAVATRNAGRSRQTLERWGFPEGRAYGDYREMLAREGCSRVAVITQGESAPAIVRDCLRAGKSVLVEKPLGFGEEEARQIEAERRGDRQLMVAFMKRYAPVYRRLKDCLSRGELGDPCSVQAAFAVDASAFCRTDRDFFFAVAIHYLDLLRYLMGEVGEVSAVRSGGKGRSYALTLRFASGAVGSLSLENRSAWTRETEWVCVTCEEGFVAARDLCELRLHRSAASPRPWADVSEGDCLWTPGMGPASGTERDLWLRGFAGEVEHFFRCCEAGEEPLTSGRDNILTARLCEQALAALEG